MVGIITKAVNNIKVSSQILILALIGVTFLIIVSIVSIMALRNIGGELVNIAEKDIPLTNVVSKITEHQLEQAISFEKAMRFGGVVSDDAYAKKHYLLAKEKFKKLMHKVEKEIVEAEDMVESFLENTNDEELTKEFTHVNEALHAIEKEHEDFDRHVVEVFEFIEVGNLVAAKKLAEQIEMEEEQLNHELSELLHELEKFTSDAAIKAEHHEKSAIKSITILIAISLFLNVIMGLLVVGVISKAIKSSTNALKEVATGNTDIEIPGIGNKNEFGEIAKAIQTFKDNTIEKVKLEQERKLAEEQSVEKNKQAMNDIADKFERKVSSMINSVAAAATELNHTAESMGGNISEVDSKAQDAAKSSQETAQNVNTVASASEEMAASVKEISGQIGKSTEVVNEAVQKAENAESSAKTLEEATTQMGSVVDLIRDIAEQINLLALNATIESARAGDAGKGFAVVASEVKNLAGQTTKATEDISKQIEGVQSVSTQVSESLNSIKISVDKVNEYSGEISTSVGEQSSATNEIAKNMQIASAGTQKVTDNVSHITGSAAHAKESSLQMLDASQMLSKEAEQLSAEVSMFLSEIREGD